MAISVRDVARRYLGITSGFSVRQSITSRAGSSSLRVALEYIAYNHDLLMPDEHLGPHQYLVSLNGRYFLFYQDDGNLVLLGPYGALWASNTNGRPAGVCIMQGDGNLVIYGPGPDREYIWDTSTYDNPGSRLVVQNDGNVVMYRPDNSVVWATNTPQANPAQGDTMQPNEALYPDQSIRSADGRYALFYQGDGNLVLSGPYGALWASNTNGRPAGVCIMQGDGNLVIYGPGPDREYIWDTSTYDNPGSRLVVQNDGNAVMYRPDNSVVWISDTLVFRSNIPNLEGWVEVRLRRDGTVQFRGHIHNGGIEAFAFQVGVAARSSLAIGMAYRGHVGGLGSPRDHDWDQTFSNPMVSVSFTRFLGASLDVQAETRGDITGFLEDVARFLVGWVIGRIVLTPGVLAVIVVGVEVGTLIVKGGFDAGARLIGGTLWLLGPNATLVALAFEGAAALGSEEREIFEVEYDFANSEVFNGTLPPRERIFLTDTIGGSGRQFTFPRIDTKITVNLGPQIYENPLGKENAHILIHELTHAWQLQNTLSEAEYVMNAIKCQLMGDAAYVIPDPLPPFAELNMEQQAQLVEDWFMLSSAERLTDPYYRYIEENIRTGRG